MVMINNSRNGTVFVENEYSKLEHVIVCPPSYMKIEEPINETQKHYINENIDKEKALQQHKEFLKTLYQYGANVIQLPPDRTLPEQVFTRDIGFTIGDTVYVSQMGTSMRNDEEKILINWLKGKGIKYDKINSGAIEGGDVIIDGLTIWVGISNRTTVEAIEELQQKLPSYEVNPVQFDSEFLHLDCLFNIISDKEALIYSKAFSKQAIKKFKRHYSFIEVNDGEQFTMGPNVLSIGNKNVLSLPINKEVNAKLRNAGYNVIELDISEIIKSGGSFRCCSLPIKRA